MKWMNEYHKLYEDEYYALQDLDTFYRIKFIDGDGKIPFEEFIENRVVTRKGCQRFDSLFLYDVEAFYIPRLGDKDFDKLVELLDALFEGQKSCSPITADFKNDEAAMKELRTKGGVFTPVIEVENRFFGHVVEWKWTHKGIRQFKNENPNFKGRTYRMWDSVQDKEFPIYIK